MEHEGLSYVVAGTDGSCYHSDHPLLARAGAGVYFGPAHRANRATGVPGGPQSAQRGEVFGLLVALNIAWSNLVIVTDSAYVMGSFRELLKNGGKVTRSIKVGSHADLWDQISSVVCESGFRFLVFWTPGHVEYSEVASGLALPVFAFLNFGADSEAKKGSAMHLPSETLLSKTRGRRAAAVQAQALLTTHRCLKQLCPPCTGRDEGFSETDIRTKAE